MEEPLHQPLDAHDAQLHAAPAGKGSRIGLTKLAQPRFGPLSEKTAALVGQILAAYPDNQNNRICGLEISVSHGKLQVGPPQQPYYKGVGDDATAPEFLADAKKKALRDGLPDAVADLMQVTGQADYIIDNAAELFKSGWRIVVDVDSYRRSGSYIGFHKDSVGRLLFFILAYVIAGKPGDKFMGPEFIVNPPPIRNHLEAIAENLPQVFMDDLRTQFDILPAASIIEYAAIPKRGYIGMVDELVHHSTPSPDSRDVGYSWDLLEMSQGFRTALRNAYGELVAKAFTTASTMRIRGNPLAHDHPERVNLNEIDPEPAAVVTRLVALKERFQASELREAVVSDKLYDELIAKAKLTSKSFYSEVTLNHATDNNDVDASLTTTHPLPILKRQLSQDRASGKPIPEMVGERSLMRLWVMAVRPRA